jgi:hypothetical protein
MTYIIAVYDQIHVPMHSKVILARDLSNSAYY